MKLTPELIKLLSEKSSLDLTVSHNCIKLAEDISTVSRRNVSASTMRRLLGFYSDDRQPQQFTLDAIALYLDCTDWDTLLKSIEQGLSGFREVGLDFDSTLLTAGQRIRLTYRPNRILTLDCLGSNAYIVESCVGSQNLQPGDVLIIRAIIRNFPLLCQSVTRSGKLLGAYTTAETTGVDNIEVL